jgi:large subunit ribosomal protein L25
MSEVLEVALRDSRGKLRSRRLRREGKLPAVLYGHGQDSVSLTIPADQVETTLRHGAHVVELKGAAKGQALLQDIQWDTFQLHVIHVDLLRVDASDRITVVIPLVRHGEAPGENEGGVVEMLYHSLEIETSPAAIPERFEINVNDLHINGELTLADIQDVSKEVKFLMEMDTTLVQCVEPTVLPDEEEAVVSGEEPEVIGQKDDDEEAGAAE